MHIFSLIVFSLIILFGILFVKVLKNIYLKLPKFIKIIVFLLSIGITFPIMMLFLQEMIIPCNAESWLMKIEKRVDMDLERNNPKQVIVINNIKKVYMIQKDTISINKVEFESKALLNYYAQLEQLNNWNYLKHLPSNINKEEYINYLSRCQYPFYLAMIHFRESSFKTNAENGSYIGLGQHHPDFIEKCGYSLKEYKKSWKVQLYVSLEYIKKYVNITINNPEELYAYWLNSNWDGNNKIYCKNSKLKNGKKPYYPNKKLDVNRNGCIEVNPDFKRIFNNLLTK